MGIALSGQPRAVEGRVARDGLGMRLQRHHARHGG